MIGKLWLRESGVFAVYESAKLPISYLLIGGGSWSCLR